MSPNHTAAIRFPSLETVRQFTTWYSQFAEIAAARVELPMLALFSRVQRSTSMGLRTTSTHGTFSATWSSMTQYRGAMKKVDERVVVVPY